MAAVVLASHEEDIQIIENLLMAHERHSARLDWSAGGEGKGPGPIELRASSRPGDPTSQIVLLAKVDLTRLEATVQEMKRRHDPPTVILVARNVSNARVREIIRRSLQAGADDFIESAALDAELLLRLEVLTEKAAQRAKLRPRRFGEILLDHATRRLTAGDKSVTLTACEFSIFLSLLRHAGMPVSRAVIQQNIARHSRSTTYNVIDVYILYLRRKLAQLGTRCFIRTARGVGYALVYEGTGELSVVTTEPSNVASRSAR